MPWFDSLFEQQPLSQCDSIHLQWSEQIYPKLSNRLKVLLTNQPLAVDRSTIGCSSINHWLFTNQPLAVDRSTIGCSSINHWLFTNQPLDVLCSPINHWLFTNQPLDVLCSPINHWLFTNQPLDVLSIYVHQSTIGCSLISHWLAVSTVCHKE